MAAERGVDMPDELVEIRQRLADALAAGAAPAPAASVPADADLAPYGAEAWLTVALAAYEQARTDGLCSEGAWECALAAARSVLAGRDSDTR